MRRLISGCFLCFLFFATVGPARGQNAKSLLDARTVLAADGASPGATLKAAVVARIADGFHINDHHPSLDYLIPTELKIEETKQVSVERVAYPKGIRRKFSFSEIALPVYEGEVLVGAVLKIGRSARPGLYTLRGKFSYQACNDHACFPPASVPLTYTVNVVRRGVHSKPLNPDVFDRIKFD